MVAAGEAMAMAAAAMVATAAATMTAAAMAAAREEVRTGHSSLGRSSVSLYNYEVLQYMPVMTCPAWTPSQLDVPLHVCSSPPAVIKVLWPSGIGGSGYGGHGGRRHRQDAAVDSVVDRHYSEDMSVWQE